MVQDAADEIDRRLVEIEGTMRLLLAVRLVDKGHAPNLLAAMKLTQDREALDRIFEREGGQR